MAIIIDIQLVLYVVVLPWNIIIESIIFVYDKIKLKI